MKLKSVCISGGIIFIMIVIGFFLSKLQANTGSNNNNKIQQNSMQNATPQNNTDKSFQSPNSGPGLEEGDHKDDPQQNCGNEPPEGIIAFTNSKNNCYLNSVLQLLFTLKVFRKDILNYKGDGLLIQALKKTFSSMDEPNPIKHDPIEIMNILNKDGEKQFFVEGGSNDPEELLAELLAKINNEENDLTDQLIMKVNNPIYKGISSSFSTVFEISCVCTACNFKYCKEQNEISQRYQSTLDTQNFKINAAYISPTVCNICSKKYSSDPSTKIISYPKYLVVFLQRNPGINEKEQSGFNIYDSIKLHDVKYRLKGFIEHLGVGTVGGHYICFTIRNSKWYKFNDIEHKELSAEAYEEQKKANKNIIIMIFERE